MKKLTFILFVAGIFNIGQAISQENDTLAIHYLGHSSLMFEYQNITVHVDPRDRQANYDALPDADFIFITHGHGDHYELKAINKIKKDPTLLLCNKAVKDEEDYSGNIESMDNGAIKEFDNFTVEAVPAYNHTAAYHPKGEGNGYVFSFGEYKVYVGGDTEDIPEMDSIETNVAFLPMNQPYTMTEEQAANAALMVNPEILYIYHNGGSDNEKLKTLLKDHDSIEVRIEESTYLVKTSTGETWKHVKEPDPVSVPKKKAVNEIKLYPNPAQSRLQLERLQPGNRITIVNSEGKIMFDDVCHEVSKSLSVEHFKSGNYIVKIISENQETSYGFVKI